MGNDIRNNNYKNFNRSNEYDLKKSKDSLNIPPEDERVVNLRARKERFNKLNKKGNKASRLREKDSLKGFRENSSDINFRNKFNSKKDINKRRIIRKANNKNKSEEKTKKEEQIKQEENVKLENERKADEQRKLEERRQKEYQLYQEEIAKEESIKGDSLNSSYIYQNTKKSIENMEKGIRGKDFNLSRKIEETDNKSDERVVDLRARKERFNKLNKKGNKASRLREKDSLKGFRENSSDINFRNKFNSKKDINKRRIIRKTNIKNQVGEILNSTDQNSTDNFRQSDNNDYLFGNNLSKIFNKTSKNSFKAFRTNKTRADFNVVNFRKRIRSNFNIETKYSDKLKSNEGQIFKNLGLVSESIENQNKDKNIGVSTVTKSGIMISKAHKRTKELRQYKKNEIIRSKLIPEDKKIKEDLELRNREEKLRFDDDYSAVRRHKLANFIVAASDVLDRQNKDKNIGVSTVTTSGKIIRSKRVISRTKNIFSGDRNKYYQKKKNKTRISTRIRNGFKNTFSKEKIFSSGGKAVNTIVKVAKASAFKPLLIVGVVLILLLAILGSCANVAMLGAGAIADSSYLASFQDVTDADKYYMDLEAKLKYELENIKRVYPGYDEYKISKDTIGHDPHLLMAYLTVKYEDFNFIQIKGELDNIFKWQYQYQVTKRVETRYRIKKVIDPSGRIISIREPYKVKILEASLFTNDLEEVLKGKLGSKEDIEQFDKYMISKGNFMFFNSPIKGDWKPKIKKMFGTNVINNKIEEYNGIDINCQGEDVLAVAEGKIIEVSENKIVLEDTDSWRITYENISNANVYIGQKIEIDKKIGKANEFLTIKIQDEKGNYLNPYFHLYSESGLLIQGESQGSEFNNWGQGQNLPEEGQLLDDLFIATAYTSDPAENGGYNTTAMGTPLKRGVIAVDPSVISLGTKLWVEGYGVGRAEDTGGAIRGKRLDLLMDSDTEANNWGIRTVRVAILPDSYKPEITTTEDGKAIINEAQKWLGTRYAYGSKDPRSGGIDCSGFTRWAYVHGAGKNIPHGSQNQYAQSQKISRSEAQPGDLIFFRYTFKDSAHPWGSITHVGIYLGNGQMVHAGNPVKVGSIDDNYWRGKIAGFGRF
ncbi:NlpC/P60 family protein [Peptoniphilus sp. GNH]|nr:NlpC/P60 family protein [Peptoniphilus sp. GNH]